MRLHHLIVGLLALCLSGSAFAQHPYGQLYYSLDPMGPTILTAIGLGVTYEAHLHANGYVGPVSESRFGFTLGGGWEGYDDYPDPPIPSPLSFVLSPAGNPFEQVTAQTNPYGATVPSFRVGGTTTTPFMFDGTNVLKLGEITITRVAAESGHYSILRMESETYHPENIIGSDSTPDVLGSVMLSNLAGDGPISVPTLPLPALVLLAGAAMLVIRRVA